MRILSCHNYYQQAGGEDRCFEDEGKLLEQFGHSVVRYVRTNEDIHGTNAIATAMRAVWNPRTYREVRQLIREHRIDLVHCTNTFPLISPAVYSACRRERVPVVQGLQNYRLMCANAYFLREGKVCEACLGKSLPWQAVLHRCYRDSHLASLAVASMQAIHQAIGSWRTMVDQFIVPTDFARQKFLEYGISADRMAVKANFVDPQPLPGNGAGGYILFAGRLSPEKGIESLLEAWRRNPGLPVLKIAGDGPLRELVERASQSHLKIDYLGFLNSSQLIETMRDAACLVVPSLWYEGMPRTMIESFSVGTPILASNIGPLGGMVHPGSGGLAFEVGNPQSIAETVEHFMEDPNREARRLQALQEFSRRYSAEANYLTLLGIYATAFRVFQQRFPDSLRPIPIPMPLPEFVQRNEPFDELVAAARH